MFLVDTSVVSYFVRNSPLKELYRTEIESVFPLFISVQTLAEIMAGVDRHNWSERRRAGLRKYLDTHFDIFPIDESTASFYVSMRNGSARLGRSIAVADSWIAATAKQHDLTLVTHDGGMIVSESLGVRVICRK